MTLCNTNGICTIAFCLESHKLMKKLNHAVLSIDIQLSIQENNT